MLDDAAAETGKRLSDLTVLSLGLDPYRRDTPAGHAMGKWFADQVDRFVKPEATVHLRGLHYRIVSVGDVRQPGGRPYLNSAECWEWLQEDASKAARWLGYVPFDRIIDERNEPPRTILPEAAILRPAGARVVAGVEIEALPDLADLMPGLLCTFGVTKSRQPYRVALLGEKSSLHEASETMIYELCERASGDPARRLVVLYFSDFDPSGRQMAVSVARKIQAHRDLQFHDLDAALYPIALTIDQVIEHDLPSTPLKAEEARAAGWIEKFGREQTEIDALLALRPGVLERIARDAVRPFFDDTLSVRHDRALRRWQQDVDLWLAAHPSYRAIEPQLRGSYDTLAAATDLFEGMRDRAADRVEEFVRTAADAPEIPEPPAWRTDATAPQPLFDTEDDYAEATRKLIEHKRLTG